MASTTTAGPSEQRPQADHPDNEPAVGDARVSPLDRRVARWILAGMSDPPFRLVLWNGEEIGTASADCVARIRLADRKTLYGLALDADLHFGEGYTDGRIEVEGDLQLVLETAYHGIQAARKTDAPWKEQLRKWVGRVPSNTLDRARKHIAHHYDLGNDFYRLWLDDAMVYTCAYFPQPEATLEEAQRAKMDHVARKLWLKQGETVVEAGCGWGSLALHLARHYGVRVRAFNISSAQVAYARQRAQEAGLADQVEFIEDDYRNIQGKYDAFVSVGMLEHVGPDHYDELGRVVERSLLAGGRGLIHSIGRDRPTPPSPWIQRRIFPGGYPTSLRQMLAVIEPHGLSVLDVENIRLHYAVTLRHWLARFERAAGQIEAMFDQRFVRMWRLYLTGSIAAFTTGSMQLFQVLFARSGGNDIPWTRDRIYSQD